MQHAEPTYANITVRVASDCRVICRGLAVLGGTLPFGVFAVYMALQLHLLGQMLQSDWS
jgi:hypothetical protein